MLIDAYLLSIKNITRLYAKPLLNNAFLEIFEEQWTSFKFVDYEILNKVIRSPWSLVPVFEEKYRSKLPAFLKPSENELQEMRNAIQQFLTLRHMIYLKTTFSVNQSSIGKNIKGNSEEEKANDFPFAHEHRDVYDWKLGETIEVELDKTLVLCNLQIGNSLEIRYVVLDPEFFILIEPDFNDSPVKTIRIEIKAPLKNIDTKTDFRDPKRLTIGISELTDQGEEILNKCTLHFESAYSCRSVKKTIDDNKKNQKRFLDTLIQSYFEKCIDDLQDEDAI